jgi:hypothetical protein
MAYVESRALEAVVREEKLTWDSREEAASTAPIS